MKKLFISLLLLFGFGFVNFGYCQSCTVNDKVSENILFSGSKSFNTNFYNMFSYGDEGPGTYCLTFTSDNPQTLSMGFANSPIATPTNLYSLYNDQYGNTICLYGNKPYLNVKLNSSSNTIDYTVYKLTDLLSDDIPCGLSSGNCDYSSYESQIDSLTSSLSSCSSSYNQCITDYGTCSSSLNYCYFDLGNCRAGVCSGDISTNLFINNIQYPINSNLFVNVPTEFDYVYSMTGNDSLIDIEYKVDSEYIEGIIDTQSTLPNNVDFNNIITNVLPSFVPGLVIILFIYFIFRFIKKIF